MNMKIMMKALLLVTLLPTVSIAADAVARISDANARGLMMGSQIDEIIRRSSLDTNSCAELLAPLPGPGSSGTMRFAEATTALEKVSRSVASDYPAECINTLLQDLALISPTTPAIARIMSTLSSYEQIVWGTNTKSLACEVHESGIEQLLVLAQNAQTVNSCAPLQNNKWKRVSGAAAHGNTINYSLNKSDAGIRVALNIDFKQATSALAPGVTRVSGETMMARARGCMQAVGSLIRGPAGEPMIFDLLTPTEAARMPTAVRPKLNAVTIDHAADVRSNAANYAHDVGCPTIVHEILHLVGLCDEYPGEGDGKICRAVPQQNNVMADTFAAFNSSVPRRLTCECNTPECSDALARPGRLDFLKAPRWADRTSARFRNAFCTTPEGTSTEEWKAEDAAPPKQPFTATLSSDGLKLNMVDYYMNPGDWQSVYGNTTECTCPAEDTRCRETLAQIASGAMKANTRECHFGMQSKGVVWGPTSQGDVVSGDKFSFTVTPVSTPFVHPKHVQRILAGSCMTQVTSYNNCAKNAYASTPAECADAPAYCLQSDFHDQP